MNDDNSLSPFKCDDESLESNLNTDTRLENNSEQPIGFRKQWVLDGLPAWAHSGLPTGWSKTTHQSGIPIYIHRDSHVVSLCKPYRLGNADLKSHNIPVSSIPCAYYNILCNYEQKKEATINNTADQSNDVKQFNTINDSRRASEAFDVGSFSEQELRSYCENKFKFKEIQFPYFANFSSKCKYKKHSSVDLKRKSESTESKEDDCKIRRTNEPIENSVLSQLHTICSRKLKASLSYESLTQHNNQTGFRMLIKIGDEHFCEGTGISKKAAKIDAAKKTITLLETREKNALMPKLMIDNRIIDNPKQINDNQIIPKATITDEALDLFSQYSVTSESIFDLSQTVMSPCPYSALKSLIDMDYFHFQNGLDQQIQIVAGTIYSKLSCKKYKAVGNDESTIVEFHGEGSSIQNKEDACSKAAQHIISEMFPDIKYWTGVLLLIKSMEVASYPLTTKDDIHNDTYQNIIENDTRNYHNGIDWTLINEIRSELRHHIADSKQINIFEI